MKRKNGFWMAVLLLASGVLSVAGVVYYYEVYKAASNTVEFSSRTASRLTEEAAEEVTLDVISDGDSTQMVYETDTGAASVTAAQDSEDGSETETAEEAVAAEETVVSEETVAAEETVAPEETVAAEETVVSEETVAAEESVIPEETVAAEETVAQEEVRYAGPDDFIISDSDSVALSAEDIADMTAKELNYARNEIYARRGRKFQSRELQDYFNSKSWYSASIEADSFTDDMLTDVERANTRLLLEREKELLGGTTYTKDKNRDSSDVRILR